MKNLWATSAMGLGIGIAVAGFILVAVSPVLSIFLGLVPIFFGVMGLKKLKLEPDAGGKPKCMIGIFVGIALILVSLYLLVLS